MVKKVSDVTRRGRRARAPGRSVLRWGPRPPFTRNRCILRRTSVWPPGPDPFSRCRPCGKRRSKPWPTVRRSGRLLTRPHALGLVRTMARQWQRDCFLAPQPGAAVFEPALTFHSTGNLNALLRKLALYIYFILFWQTGGRKHTQENKNPSTPRRRRHCWACLWPGTPWLRERPGPEAPPSPVSALGGPGAGPGQAAQQPLAAGETPHVAQEQGCWATGLSEPAEQSPDEGWASPGLRERRAECHAHQPRPQTNTRQCWPRAGLPTLMNDSGGAAPQGLTNT